ncbi:CDP-alcohol phosphatidyltransferase family protein [Planctomonas deserti]|jgi:phosphatidylglycerophosphate synthase|uniref:CDP-alcohol phosphatidyltransferase family protein n=1 Tax=Planctomonas deserti TaxID=2144185 RepID=UPI000D3769B7|nr:CDP-alcohol phosphatidyltransferase family protein [Planctomonas deserti]
MTRPSNETTSARPSGATPRQDRSFGASVRALAASQKSSKGAPAYSRYVNRPLGRVFAALAYGAGLTPNGVTAISAVTTFAGIAVIATLPPTPGFAVLTSVLLVLGYALDSADGQLARLRGGGSLVGEWLDHIVDSIKSSALHAAVAIAWFRFLDLDPVWLLVPLGYTVVSAVFFFGMILTDQLRRLNRGSTEMILRHEGRTSLAYSLAVIPADYGLLCLVFLLAWWSPVFVGIYSLLFLANLLILAASLVRWYRAVAGLQRNPA